MTVPRALVALALAGTLAACQVRIARFSLVGTTAEAGTTAVAPAGRTTGVSCRWWVLGAPIGPPRIEEAVADAVARAGSAEWLRDVELDSVHRLYGPIGRHCYAVTGTPWTPEAR